MRDQLRNKRTSARVTWSSAVCSTWGSVPERVGGCECGTEGAHCACEDVPAGPVPRAPLNTPLINQVLSVAACTRAFWLKFTGNHWNLK